MLTGTFRSTFLSTLKPVSEIVIDTWRPNTLYSHIRGLKVVSSEEVDTWEGTPSATEIGQVTLVNAKGETEVFKASEGKSLKVTNLTNEDEQLLHRLLAQRLQNSG